MGLPIELPGLDVLIEEVPDGRIVLVEGGMGPAKTFFAERVARDAAADGRRVLLITSREREIVLERMSAKTPPSESLEVVALEDWNEAGIPKSGDRDLVVDAFSFFMIGRPATDVAEDMRALRSYCQRSGRAAILVMEHDMLPADVESIVHHLSDGSIQFHVREGSEGLQQFLRIPRWARGEVFVQNVYYDFDGKRLLIDTRRRVQ